MKIYDYNGKKNISGDRIREARQKMRLSQTDLAARMQVEGVLIERASICKSSECLCRLAARPVKKPFIQQATPSWAIPRLKRVFYLLNTQVKHQYGLVSAIPAAKSARISPPGKRVIRPGGSICRQCFYGYTRNRQLHPASKSPAVAGIHLVQCHNTAYDSPLSVCRMWHQAWNNRHHKAAHLAHGVNGMLRIPHIHTNAFQFLCTCR